MRFLTNAQMLALMFEPDTRKPSDQEVKWDRIVTLEQPRAMPPASATTSVIPGVAMPVGHN